LTDNTDKQQDARRRRRWTRLVFFLCGILAAWGGTTFLASLTKPMPGPPDGASKAVFSIVLITFGVLCAVLYWRPPAPFSADPRFESFHDRPWRRVGAAICLIVSIMFVLGVYLVDIPDHPRVYAAFWVVILLLLFWACGLAIKDAWHTRRLLARWRRERRSELSATYPAGVHSRDSKP
jgi:hypothetical protein